MLVPRGAVRCRDRSFSTQRLPPVLAEKLRAFLAVLAHCKGVEQPELFCPKRWVLNERSQLPARPARGTEVRGARDGTVYPLLDLATRCDRAPTEPEGGGSRLGRRP